MHANIKLVAVGTVLALTLYTTLLHGTRAMGPIDPPTAAPQDDTSAPSAGTSNT